MMNQDEHQRREWIKAVRERDALAETEGLPPDWQAEADEIPGYVWCIEHQRYERIDDQIDFKCAPEWLAHYHEQGLTFRRPIGLMPMVEQAAHETYSDPELLRNVLEECRDAMVAVHKAFVAAEGRSERRRAAAGPPVREVQTGSLPPPPTPRPTTKKKGRGVEL